MSTLQQDESRKIIAIGVAFMLIFLGIGGCSFLHQVGQQPTMKEATK